MAVQPKYKRVLIKLSGEALSNGGNGYSDIAIANIVDQIVQLHNANVQVGVVIGAGNIWRGRQGAQMDRTRADHMGMLATIINSIALQDALINAGVPTVVQTMVSIDKIGEFYSQPKAIEYLEQGKVVIFGGGTGSPYFTTDTAGVLKAVEIYADIILCAKNIDGVYDSDPRTNPQAFKFDDITYQEVIARNLKATDLTAISLAMENGLPILLFDCNQPNSIINAINGKKIGTIIK